jgi:CBS domain-containing protein
MASKHIHAVPVVGKNRKVMGIVTTVDLARNLEDEEPARHVMTDMVATISATQSVGEAARIMREKRIHHLVVTDGPTAVGIVSSYDLLRLVEQKFAEPPAV